MATPTPDVLDTEVYRQFEEQLSKWTDNRFLDQDQVRALGLFTVYIVNLADHFGWVYCGHSFKVSVGMSTLTIKSMVDDLPMVCFTSGRTFQNCVKIFIRKMLGDMVEWRNDQYR